MSLPTTFDPASPPNSQAPSLGDDRIREMKQQLVDILGIWTDDPITVAYFTGGASGLTGINFRSSTANGTLFTGTTSRSGRSLRYDDGTHAQFINGTLSWQTTVVGNVGAGADDLMSYTIPAGLFEESGGIRALEIMAAGTFADTVGNKTLRFKVGSGSALTLNGVTAGPQNKMWWAHFILYSASTNSQYATGQFVIDPGSTEGPVNSTWAESTSSAIIIKFTGESAAPADNDVTQRFMLVRAAGGTGIV